MIPGVAGYGTHDRRMSAAEANKPTTTIPPMDPAIRGRQRAILDLAEHAEALAAATLAAIPHCTGIDDVAYMTARHQTMARVAVSLRTRP